MPSISTEFAGFEDPPVPEDLRLCTTWPERVESLAENHEGKWAKFGVFGSKKTAQNTASNVRSYAERHGYLEPAWSVHTRTAVEGGEWFLFVKLTNSV